MIESLVSVVMPAYNAESTIEDAILSVISQTYSHVELIVVNDCSSDNTDLIVRSLQVLNNFTYIKFDKNQGVAAARNSAISNASGEYLAFLDADDIWLPNKLALQIEALKNSTAIGCSSSYIPFKDSLIFKTRVPPKVINYERMLSRNSIGLSTFIYSVKKIGKYYMPIGVGHEDYITWLDMLSNRDRYVLGLHYPLVLYRLSSNSVSSNKLRAAIWQWSIYRKILRLPVLICIYHFVSYSLHNGLRAVLDRLFRIYLKVTSDKIAFKTSKMK